MSKRVCMIRQEYFPSEAHVKKNLDALTEAGFSVDVICLREKGERAREPYGNGTIYRMPLTRRRSSKLRYLFEYAAFFLMATCFVAYRTARRRYDIVEAYSMPDFLVFAALPAKLLGAKVILYLFEMMPEMAASDYALREDHPLVGLMRWIERRSVQFADHVICVSKFQEEIVVERSAPRAMPAVVLNVPDETLFSANGAGGAAGGRDEFLVLTHGSILQRYGIQTLIRAVPYLRDEIPNLLVEVLGEGDYREELEALAAELDVVQYVRFSDFVPIEQVPAAIARADIGVVATAIEWLLPNKLFEYIAMERVVVAAANPSITGVFNSKAIAYFWPDDERDLARRVLELYRDPSKARSMVESAREQFEPSRWSEMKRRYVELHKSLVHSNATHPQPTRSTP